MSEPSLSPSPDRSPGRRPSLLEIGAGVAATGAGAALGMVAERLTAGRWNRHEPGRHEPGRREPVSLASIRARRARPPRPAQPAQHGDARHGDGRGGPALGSLRGTPVSVVTDDGVRLHVEVDELDGAAGRHPSVAPTVVLSHGYALSLDSWHYQRMALRGRCRLVLWDQRGHGRSGTGPAGSSTIERVGADLAAVLEAVAPQGPLMLLGHSMGGMTVMSLAAHDPRAFTERVVGVGLLATSAGELADMDLGLAGLGRLLMRAAPTAARVAARNPALLARGRRLGSDLESLLVRRYSYASPVPPQLVAFAAQLIADTRIEVISDFLPAFTAHDKYEALAALAEAEVLVAVGERDLMLPPRHSERIARALPHADFLQVPKAGHLFMLEHPEAVNEAVLGLLERAERAARGRRDRRGWRQRVADSTRQRLQGRDVS